MNANDPTHNAAPAKRRGMSTTTITKVIGSTSSASSSSTSSLSKIQISSRSDALPATGYGGFMNPYSKPVQAAPVPVTLPVAVSSSVSTPMVMTPPIHASENTSHVADTLHIGVIGSEHNMDNTLYQSAADKAGTQHQSQSTAQPLLAPNSHESIIPSPILSPISPFTNMHSNTSFDFNFLDSPHQSPLATLNSDRQSAAVMLSSTSNLQQKHDEGIGNEKDHRKLSIRNTAPAVESEISSTLTASSSAIDTSSSVSPISIPNSLPTSSSMSTSSTTQQDQHGINEEGIANSIAKGNGVMNAYKAKSPPSLVINAEDFFSVPPPMSVHLERETKKPFVDQNDHEKDDHLLASTISTVPADFSPNGPVTEESNVEAEVQTPYPVDPYDQIDEYEHDSRYQNTFLHVSEPIYEEHDVSQTTDLSQRNDQFQRDRDQREPSQPQPFSAADYRPPSQRSPPSSASFDLLHQPHLAHLADLSTDSSQVLVYTPSPASSVGTGKGAGSQGKSFFADSHYLNQISPPLQPHHHSHFQHSPPASSAILSSATAATTTTIRKPIQNSLDNPYNISSDSESDDEVAVKRSQQFASEREFRKESRNTDHDRELYSELEHLPTPSDPYDYSQPDHPEHQNQYPQYYPETEGHHEQYTYEYEEPGDQYWNEGDQHYEQHHQQGHGQDFYHTDEQQSYPYTDQQQSYYYDNNGHQVIDQHHQQQHQQQPQEQDFQYNYSYPYHEQYAETSSQYTAGHGPVDQSNAYDGYTMQQEYEHYSQDQVNNYESYQEYDHTHEYPQQSEVYDHDNQYYSEHTASSYTHHSSDYDSHQQSQMQSHSYYPEYSESIEDHRSQFSEQNPMYSKDGLPLQHQPVEEQQQPPRPYAQHSMRNTSSRTSANRQEAHSMNNKPPMFYNPTMETSQSHHASSTLSAPPLSHQSTSKQTVSNSETENPQVSEDEKKKRHLQVWEKFFENAIASRLGSTGDDEDQGSVSVHSNGSVNKNTRIASLKDLVMSATTGNNGNNNNTALSTTRQTIVFHSNEAKKYFVVPPFYATATSSSSLSKSMKSIDLLHETAFPSMISPKRYQLLIAYAKAIGNSHELKENHISYLAWFASVIMNDFLTFEYFLNQGLNLNICDEMQRSILFYVIYYCQMDLQFLSLLNDNNVDFDHLDQSGNSCLHFAVIHGKNVEMIEFLLQCAVDLTRKNREGLTALDLARQIRRKKVIHLLERMEDLPLTEFSDDDEQDDADLVETTVSSSKDKGKERNRDKDRERERDRESKLLKVKELSDSSNNREKDREREKQKNHDEDSDQKSRGATRNKKQHQHRGSSSLSVLTDNLDDISTSKPPKAPSISVLTSSSASGPPMATALSKGASGLSNETLMKKTPKSSLHEVLQVRDSLLAATANTSNKKRESDKQGDDKNEDGDDDDVSELGSDMEDHVDGNIDGRNRSRNVYDQLASYVWSFIISMLNLTLAFLTNNPNRANTGRISHGDSKNESRPSISSSTTANLVDNKHDPQLMTKEMIRTRGVSTDYSDSDNDTSWKNRSAPPTDAELSQQGLGSKLAPPQDVQLAIAMSRVGMNFSSSNPPPSLPPLHPTPSIPPPITTTNHLAMSIPKSPSSDTEDSQVSQVSSSPPTPVTAGSTPNPNPGSNGNNYSIGRNLPPGVSWRYVNILDDVKK